MTASLFDIRDKSAIIVGATGALGSSVARIYARNGVRCLLAGGNEQRLAELTEELSADGAAIQSINKRPETEADCRQILDAAISAHGRVDILFVASGASVVKPALEMKESEWSAVMDANVRQAWLISRTVGARMVEQGDGGKIILVSSIRGRFATAAGTSAYGPSKAAIDMMTRSLAVEWGRHRINVNAIAPTVFRSQLTQWLFSDEANDKRQGLLERIPLGRLAEPDDHQGVTVFLSSPASDFITGQVIYVDGGFSAN